jgi:hypothetical protein
MESLNEYILNLKNNEIDVYHYSRMGDDLKYLDNYTQTAHFFDSVGLHVGNSKTIDYIHNAWKNLHEERNKIIYPLVLTTKKPLLNDDGSFKTENQLYKLFDDLSNEIESNKGISKYSVEMQEEVRKDTWSKYDSIPYINDIESKGEVSYICPAESLKFKLSPHLNTTKILNNKPKNKLSI